MKSIAMAGKFSSRDLFYLISFSLIIFVLVVPLAYNRPLNVLDEITTLTRMDGVRANFYPGGVFSFKFRIELHHILDEYFFGFLSFISQSIPFLRMCNIIWILGNITLIYYFAKKLGDLTIALGAVLLTISNVSFIYSGSIVRYYHMTIFLGLLTTIFLWEFYKNEKRWALYSGLICSILNMLCWRASAALWPGIFLFFLINAKGKKYVFKEIFKAGLIFLAFIIIHKLITDYIAMNWFHLPADFYMFVKGYGLQFAKEKFSSIASVTLFVHKLIYAPFSFLVWPRIIFLIIAALFYIRNKKIQYLLLISAPAYILMWLFARRFWPRYLLLLLPSFTIITAYTLYHFADFICFISRKFGRFKHLKYCIYSFILFTMLFYQVSCWRYPDPCYGYPTITYYRYFFEDIFTGQFDFLQGGRLLKRQKLLFETLKDAFVNKNIAVAFPHQPYYYLRIPLKHLDDKKNVFMPEVNSYRHDIYLDSEYVPLKDILGKESLIDLVIITLSHSPFFEALSNSKNFKIIISDDELEFYLFGKLPK